MYSEGCTGLRETVLWNMFDNWWRMEERERGEEGAFKWKEREWKSCKGWNKSRLREDSTTSLISTIPNLNKDSLELEKEGEERSGCRRWRRGSVIFPLTKMELSTKCSNIISDFKKVKGKPLSLISLSLSFSHSTQSHSPSSPF